MINFEKKHAKKKIRKEYHIKKLKNVVKKMKIKKEKRKE